MPSPLYRSSPQEWPAWSRLAVWMIACAILSALLVHIRPLLEPLGPYPIDLWRFAPGLALGVVILMFRGEDERPRLELGRRPSVPLLIGVLLALVVAGVIVVSALAARDTWLGVRTEFPHLGLPLALMIIVAIVHALAEETAWRGWLQPELEQWWGPLTAAAATGLVWGMWFILILRPGPQYAITFLITSVALSVAIRAILRTSPGHNLLVGTAFHTVINIGLRIMPERGGEQIVAWALAGSAVVVAAVLWMISRIRPAPVMPLDEFSERDEVELAEAELAEAELAEAELAEAELAEAELAEAELAEAELAEAELAAVELEEVGLDEVGLAETELGETEPPRPGETTA